MGTPTARTPGYGTYRAREYAGGPVKSWVACVCLLEWLPALNDLLIFKGILKQPVFIFQLTGAEAESAGTHSQGGVFDLGHWTTPIALTCREMGAPATWIRYKPRFSSDHTHGVLTGCPHNEPARYQIAEQLAGGDGLIGTARDPLPDPKVYRTWKQGVAYARGVMNPSAFQLRELKYGYRNDEIKKFQKWMWSKQPESYKAWFRANMYDFDKYGFTTYYGASTARMVADTYKRLDKEYPDAGWDYGVIGNSWPDEPGPGFIKHFGGSVYI